MPTRFPVCLAPAVLLALCYARPAAAAPTVFDLTYSGASFGNGASAAGTLTLDPSLLPNPDFSPTDITDAVSALTLTVSGAVAGDGTFTFTDYSPSDGGGVTLDTAGGTLDFTKPLIGQPTLGDPFGTTRTGSSGDFSVFPGAAGIAAGAPGAVAPFTLGTDDGQGEFLLLTGFTPATPPPAVPEPSTVAPFALAGLGLLGLMVRARRRSQ